MRIRKESWSWAITDDSMRVDDHPLVPWKIKSSIEGYLNPIKDPLILGPFNFFFCLITESGPSLFVKHRYTDLWITENGASLKFQAENLLGISLL